MKPTAPALAIALAFPAFAGGGAAKAQDDARDKEYVVLEDLSISQLRREIEKVENEYYRVFNLHTDDARLHVICGEYTPTGSHIPRRSCEPRFLAAARAGSIGDWYEEAGALQGSEDLAQELRPAFESLTAAMNELLRESEYFRGLHADLSLLRGRLRELTD